MCDAGKGQERVQLRFDLIRYRSLQLVAERPNDHLLQDAGLSREEAHDLLKPRPILSWLFAPRDLWRSLGNLAFYRSQPRTGRMKLRS